MKYHGNVGYIKMVETSPGVYEEQIKELSCYGDVTRNHSKWNQGIGINDDLDISNNFSLMLHPILVECFMDLKYIEWMGVRWKIQTVELSPPRLNILVGGVYNESEESETSDGTREPPGE